MANHHGNEGKVIIGASNVVGEVKSWDMKEGIDLADDTVMGDADKTHKPGQKSWSGSVTCNWDETDTLGQVPLTNGASVTLKLCPEGNGSGATYFTGTATVNGVQRSGNPNSIVQAQFDFTGNGPCTLTTFP